MNSTRPKPITLEGRTFPSQSAAARHYGVDTSTIHRWAFMRFDKPPAPKRDPKPVRIEGIFYPSIREAARQLPISYSAIRNRLNSPRWPTYQYEEPHQ